MATKKGSFSQARVGLLSGVVLALAFLTWGLLACSSTSSRDFESTTTLTRQDVCGLGDPYFPQAGNSGYDVLSYELNLSVDPKSGAIKGIERVTAQAQRPLGQLSLDLTGLQVKEVQLEKTRASFRRQGGELLVHCPRTVKAGEKFVISVSYQGKPEPVEFEQQWGRLLIGWHCEEGFVYTMNEPTGASTWYPVNDHPKDKASYVFRVTVPLGYTAACGGTLVTVERMQDQETYVWEMREPLASYAAGLVVGKLVEDARTAPNGVPLRSYFAPELAEQAGVAFLDVGEILAYYSDLFGPYPFEAYGVAVIGASTQGAMENQTLSLYGKNILEKQMADPVHQAVYVSHELAHQWFGNSVTPESWRDIWLNEGFATYATWLWLEKELGRAALEEMVARSFEALSGQDLPPPADPGVENLFGPAVYERGALTLHALRLGLGDQTFFALLRQWASRYSYSNASTQDFIELAKSVARQAGAPEVGDLLHSWLYEAKMPTLSNSPQSSECLVVQGQ